MTLGSRGLTSPTAKFSMLDLDKPVMIRAAGLFVTTIQSVTSATGNLCITPGGQGINLSSSRASSCDDVVIEQNMLVATGPCAEGVQVQSDISAVNGISVRDNDITVKGSGAWATGILFSGNKIHHVSAVGNSLRGVATGIKFEGNVRASAYK